MLGNEKQTSGKRFKTNEKKKKKKGRKGKKKRGHKQEWGEMKYRNRNSVTSYHKAKRGRKKDREEERKRGRKEGR